MAGTRARRGLLADVAGLLVAALLVAACGRALPTPRPTAFPSAGPGSTAAPGPSGRLVAPVNANDLFVALRSAGLEIIGNNTRVAGGEPRRTISATYASWPLYIEEFGSAKALAKRSGFNPKKKPVAGDPPYVIVGANILVAYGPIDARRKPGKPDARHAEAARALVLALDPLIGPLRQRSAVPVALPTPTTPPTPTGASSTPGPLGSPATSPGPGATSSP